MDLQISGKVALVTGSNRGIGKATAITLSKEGADVALLARNEKLLSQTKNEISSIAPNNNGAWVTPYILDRNDPNTIFIGYDELYKSTWINCHNPI